MDGRVIEGDESMDRGDGNNDRNNPAVDAAAANDNSDGEDNNAEANPGNDERAARRMRLIRAEQRHPMGANRSQRAAPNENDNGSAASRNFAEPNLIQLIERIRDFLSEEEGAIDEEQAIFALEASAGDLEVAVSLYCDNYYAQHVQRNARRPALPPAQENEEESPRRVRRRLEEQLEEPRAANNDGGGGVEHDEDPDVMEDDQEMDAPVPRNRRAPPRRVAFADRGEGAAVSDDEGPRRPPRRSYRRVQLPRREPEDNIAEDGNIQPADPLIRSISDNVDHPGEDAASSLEHQLALKRDDKDEMDNDFLDDNDWIFDEEGADSPASVVPDVTLWGKQSSSSVSSSGNGDNNEAGEGANNVIAEDDDGEGGPPSARGGIPRTWLHAGFTSSTCGTGLVTQPPPDDEISLDRWRQSQNGDSRNIAPPPYHCRGVTVLLSVVTALIYSGASIQGPSVNCKAAREPFAKLSEEDRKRQFDARLIDALSSLLFIAARASRDRKKRALTKRQLPSDKRQEQSLHRKLRLCPTCRWENDPGTGDGSMPGGQTVQLATSYTNIDDIRAYVMSTFRSFTKKGGCALFLETIIRIHGKTCVEWMLRAARREGAPRETNVLIQCSCDHKQKHLQRISAVSGGGVDTPEPLDHTCASTELLTLLLTGEVHSTFHGWNTNGLGIGILSNKHDEVGRQLMKPEQPVWILRGGTCYSVLWLDNGVKDQSTETIQCIDQPSTVFRLTHWHCWFGDRNKSGMRVITARGDWAPPVFSKPRCNSSDRTTVTQALLARNRERSNIVSSDEQRDDENEPIEAFIAKEDIDRVKIHPDDEKLYPKNYRQWRFSMGKAATASDKIKANVDSKMAPVEVEREHWTPYFRLDARQRMVVEVKVSPKINQILWTRWPGATIDRFTPEGEEPPVV